MKNIIVVLILSLTLGLGIFLFGAQKAQAFDLPDFNICDLVPQLCEQGPSISPPVDEITPTAEITPDPTGEISPTVDEVTPTVTPDPTNPPSNNGGDNHGDGKSDGRSDGLCSKPPCVSGNSIPKGPPATGRGL